MVKISGFQINSFGCVRAVEKIKYPRWRRSLLPYSRRDEASISGYVRFIATKKTKQKTSRMGYFIFSTALIGQGYMNQYYPLPAAFPKRVSENLEKYDKDYIFGEIRDA